MLTGIVVVAVPPVRVTESVISDNMAVAAKPVALDVPNLNSRYSGDLIGLKANKLVAVVDIDPLKINTFVLPYPVTVVDRDILETFGREVDADATIISLNIAKSLNVVLNPYTVTAFPITVEIETAFWVFVIGEYAG